MKTHPVTYTQLLAHKTSQETSKQFALHSHFRSSNTIQTHTDNSIYICSSVLTVYINFGWASQH